jgi:hypothetical protein
LSYFQRFEGWTPPVRLPTDSPWTRWSVVEASSPVLGSGAVIDGPHPLAPAYLDPTDPPTYDFTTELAQLESAWYWIVWTDAVGNQSPAGPVELRAPSPYAPGVADVASRARLFLRELGGDLATNFTDETRPTAAQVQMMIANDFPLVLIRLGDLDTLPCPEAPDIRAAARAIGAERVALQVMEIYRPEDTGDGRLGIEQRQAALDADLEALVGAAASCRTGAITPDPGGGGTGGGGTTAMYAPPRGYFGRGRPIGLRTRF